MCSRPSVSTPTITAIVPTYNRAQFLPAAIESILNQTRPVDELIVVDDGSTDGTETLMRNYGNRVQYLRQKNGGAGAARNLGMRAARGEYLAFLDSDDVWTLDKNESQLSFLESHPNVDFLFGDMSIFSAENGEESGPEIKDANVHAYFVEHSTYLENFFECLVTENMVPTSSVLLRKRCLDEVGYFDGELKIAEDLDLWLRIARDHRCAFINKTLVRRRRHASNLINDWARMSLYHAKVLERAAAMHSIPPAAAIKIKQKLKALYYDLGSYFFKQRRFFESYFYLRLGGPRRAGDWQYSMKISLLSPFYRRQTLVAPQFT